MFNWGGKEKATAGGSNGHGSSVADNQLCLAQHRARCRICKHPEREEIEREFLDWVSLREIAEDWKLPSFRAIYRHAHAVGLFERRRKNRLAALDAIIERVHEVPVTASAVVAAIRLSLELEGEPTGSGRRSQAPEFLLSLEGLPRTNAVTGVAPDAGSMFPCGSTDDDIAGRATLQRAPAGSEALGSGTLQCAASSGDQEGEQAVPSQFAPAGDGAVGSGDPLGRPPAAEASCNNPVGEGQKSKPVPPGRRDVAPTKGGKARSDLAKAPADAAPQGTQPVGREVDPRIVLGEDGRVAGIPWPWPKQKIAFVRVGRRWRERGP